MDDRTDWRFRQRIANCTHNRTGWKSVRTQPECESRAPAGPILPLFLCNTLLISETSILRDFEMQSQHQNREFYRRKLPHFRIAGAIYHVRFSIFSSGVRLNQSEMFELTETSILSGHRKSCLIYAYVVMATHCHIVIEPLPKSGIFRDRLIDVEFCRLEDIVRSIKTFTALRINRLLCRSGPFWKREYFDRIVRDDEDFDTTIDYIHHNPVRWKLVKRPEDYRWSSATTIYSGRTENAGWLEWSLKEGTDRPEAGLHTPYM
jgi:REP element-mobilizing transposase RayT